VVLAVVGVLALGLVWVWLPRAAHKAFERGRFRRAATLYRVLRLFRIGRQTRAAIDVSLAACHLGLDRPDRALAIMERLDGSRLTEAVRAAWLNNKAYALARGGGDARTALTSSDEAIALRPDVVGFRHTRGVALMALGRTDDAIHELDALWAELGGDEAPPLLEAERCYDLGMAWRAKGELDYAHDYFTRARRAAPESEWARRSTEQLARTPAPATAPLEELLET
jgi:tetratricopeptide (TPR) repeat protein